MSKQKKEGLKILIVDIETTPLTGYSWGIYEQNIIKVVQDWRILCFAYKWLGDNNTYVVALPDFKERYKKDKLDDYDVSLALRNIYDEADVIIGQNLDEFDIKKSNARFIMNKIQPPSPYLTIDTKKVAKKYFKFDSNSLKDLARYFGVRRKGDPGGISTWEGCMRGDEKSWDIMKKYNKQDVVVTEDVYLMMRPWIRNHPVLTNSGMSCPKCKSKYLQKRGFERTVAGTVYQRYQCQSCGGWSRNRISEKGKPDIK